MQALADLLESDAAKLASGNDVERMYPAFHRASMVYSKYCGLLASADGTRRLGPLSSARDTERTAQAFYRYFELLWLGDRTSGTPRRLTMKQVESILAKEFSRGAYGLSDAMMHRVLFNARHSCDPRKAWRDDIAFRLALPMILALAGAVGERLPGSVRGTRLPEQERWLIRRARAEAQKRRRTTDEKQDG